MAFLLPLIPLIIEGVGEAAVIGGESAAVAAAASESAAAAATAASAASEAAAAAAAAGDADVAATATAETTAAAAEASAASVEAGSAAIEAGTGGTAVATEGEGLGSVIWKSAQAFGKWAAKEVAKGALFEAAMKGLKATIHAYQVAYPSAEAREMVALITDINAAHQSLDKCTDDWLSWMNSHYNYRDSYGSITVEGTTLQNFQILQQKVGDLNIFLHQNISPLVVAANKAKELRSTYALRDGMKGYAEKVGDVSQLVDKLGAMASAGLQDHSIDVQDAVKSLA